MKKVIRLTETQLIRLIKESIENDNLKSEENFFKRRGVDLEKLEEMIYFQESIQEVENFDDGDEFAEFCIDTAVSFYFGDEGYTDDDDDDWGDSWDEDEETEKNENNLPPESAYEVREELEEYLYKKYFNELKVNFDDYISGKS